MSATITTLGENVVTQKGFAFKSAWFCDTGRQIVKVKDFTADSVDPSEVTHVSNEIAERHLRYELRTGDVVVQTVGSWPSAPASVVGKCVRIPRTVDRALLNQNAVRLSPSSSLDGGFLYYSLKNPAFGEYIVGTAQGAASQAAITLEAIRAYKLNLPDLPTQRKIAGILSAYDDLIENNLRRIKILEQMAQSLYREWFVHFRFPRDPSEASAKAGGHESATFKDSELGLIPDGWEVKEIQEVANIHRGRSYKSSELVEEGGLPFINLKCVVRDGGFRRDGLKRFDGPYKDSHKVTTGDIVMAVTDMTQERRIVARAARVPTLDSEFGIVSMDLVTIEPRPGFSSDFLYSYFRCSDFADHLKQQANGANVLHLSPDRIKEYRFVLPAEKLMSRYSQIVGLHFDEIENLHRRNDNLRSTRDLLLPKLISHY